MQHSRHSLEIVLENRQPATALALRVGLRQQELLLIDLDPPLKRRAIIICPLRGQDYRNGHIVSARKVLDLQLYFFQDCIRAGKTQELMG